MEVVLKLSGFEDALKSFDPNRVAISVRAAINDVAKQGRNLSARIIQEEYNIQSTKLKKYLRISVQARTESLYAVITGQGQGIPRAYFEPRQVGVIANKNIFKYTNKAKRYGSLRHGGEVTTLVKKSHGRSIVPVSSKGYKPFIARMRSGHVGVFYRVSKSRLPIEAAFAVGVGGLFGTERIQKATIELITSKFAPRFYFWLNK